MQKDCWYSSVSAQFRDVINDHIPDVTWFLNAIAVYIGQHLKGFIRYDAL